MGNKKNYHGSLKLLFLPLSIMLLGMFSTCYARTTIEQNEAEYIWNYLVTFAYSGDIDNGEYLNLYRYPASNSTVYSRKDLDYSQQFMEYFNNNNTIEFRDDLQDLIIVAYCEQSSTSITIHLEIGSYNNGKFDGKPHLAFRFPAEINTGTLTINTVDDNKNNITSSKQYLRIYLRNNNTVGFDNLGVLNYNYIGSGLKTRFSSWNNPPKNETVLNCIPGVVSFSSTNSIYTNWDGTTFYSQLQPKLLQSLFDKPVEPEEPSGDTPITPSGDSGGNIDYTNQLTNINSSINNIQNQISGDTQKVIENQNQNTETIVNTISGEVGKITNTLTDDADNTIDNTIITSGDIESALNFEIAQDPYSNFWLTLTNNLKNALLGTKRSIDISFQGRTWIISLDEYMVLPAWLINILTPFSTAFFTWVLVRQFKLIFDKLASGNVDSLLKENSEERHFQFVLGGE